MTALAPTGKVYDSLIRVSKMGTRIVSAESTMTITDQASANLYAMTQAGGRLGEELRALDQSGFSVHKSDAWKLALRRIQRGESHGIVVAYGDRLSRNWRKVGAFYDDLEEAGAEVIIAGMPGVDYRTPEGRTMTGLMAVMSDAQYMAAKARGDRIADATLARGVPNRVPYGYMRNLQPDGTKVNPALQAKALVPDPERAPFVQLIFRMRANRYSWAAIRDELTRLGAPTPSASSTLWITSTLNNVIQRKTYLGTVTLGTNRAPVENAHEPLVSEKLWRAAQSVHKVTRNGNLVGGIAQGIVSCSSCGRRMQMHGSGARQPMYGCRAVHTTGKCPRPMYIRAHVVDAYVEELVASVIEGKVPGSGTFADVSASSSELASARAELDKAEAQLLAFAQLADAIDAVHFKAGYDARKATLSAARERHTQLVDRAEGAAELPQSSFAWLALDLDGRRRVASALIADVPVIPAPVRSKLAPITDRLSVVWR